MNYTISLLLLLVFVMNSCASKNKEEKFDEISELKLELTNYKDFEIDDSIVRIGTAKSYYFDNEKPRIIIDNLPKKNFKVKINGIELTPDRRSGIYTYEPKHYSGYNSNLIQISDSSGIEILVHEVYFHVGQITPFLESEHGNYLFRGISTNFHISNLAVVCPHIILSSDQAKISANGDGTYSVLPMQNIDTVVISLKTFNNYWKQEYYVQDAPPPSFYFTESGNKKCIELIPSGLFSKVKYRVSKITLLDLTDGNKSEIVDSNCISNYQGLRIQKFTYTIDNFNESYTILLE